MTALPTARIARPGLTSRPSDILLPFLVPSIQSPRNTPCSSVARFSTSPALWKRDNNKNRGVSILKHTGPRRRQKLSVTIDDLPTPVTPTTPIEGDLNHGLWGFFRDKQLFRTPVDESRHGRAWTVHELRKRPWDDLHALWWVCVKERNRLATEKLERKRLSAGYGDEENRTRDETVQDTMKAILDTLHERHNAWKDAYELAKSDPNIDLNRIPGPQLVEGDLYATEELDGDEYVNVTLDDQDAVRENEQEDAQKQESKSLPERNYFNTQDNPPTLQDKIKEKTQKILWNK